MVARSGLFVAPLAGATPAGTSPTDARIALAGVIGVTPQVADGGTITQSASVMTFTVSATVWLLADPTNAAASFLSPTDSIVLTGSAGPATGSRIDTIAVKQNNVENSDSDSRANVILVTGTAAGTPVAPTLAAGYYRYANIAVPANAATGTACTITSFSPTNISPLPITSPTSALLLTVTGLPGQFATVTADNSVWQWVTSAWKQISKPGAQPFAMATGTGSISMTGTTGSGTITMPTGRFTVNPLVMISGSTPGFGVYFVGGATSVTSINYTAYNGANGVTVPYAWTAIQMTSTTATG